MGVLVVNYNEMKAQINSLEDIVRVVIMFQIVERERGTIGPPTTEYFGVEAPYSCKAIAHRIKTANFPDDTELMGSTAPFTTVNSRSAAARPTPFPHSWLGVRGTLGIKLSSDQHERHVNSLDDWAN